MPQHVLLVDDDVQICTLVETLLREEGYDVSVAYSNERALDLLREQPVDAVLLDVIGERDGLVPMVASIRELRPAVRVVLFTAIQPGEARALQDRLGVALVQKPFDIDQLLQVLAPPSPPEPA